MMYPQSQVPWIKKDGAVRRTKCLWFHSSLLKFISHGISDAKKINLPMDSSSWSNYVGTEWRWGWTHLRASRILWKSSLGLLGKPSSRIIIPSSSQMYSSALPNTWKAKRMKGKKPWLQQTSRVERTYTRSKVLPLGCDARATLGLTEQIKGQVVRDSGQGLKWTLMASTVAWPCSTSPLFPINCKHLRFSAETSSYVNSAGLGATKHSLIYRDCFISLMSIAKKLFFLRKLTSCAWSSFRKEILYVNNMISFHQGTAVALMYPLE